MLVFYVARSIDNASEEGSRLMFTRPIISKCVTVLPNHL